MMASARSVTCPIKVVADFLVKIKRGPDYVCTSCNHMTYKHTIAPFKCTKASTDLMQKIAKHVYVSFDCKEWVCKMCDS